MFALMARSVVSMTVTGLAATVLAGGTAAAQAQREWTFAGQVAPRQTVQVANQINGIVQEIHVVAGQRVRRGDLLVSLDDADARIAIAVAQAALEEANARMVLASDIARRQNRLVSSGTGRKALAVQRTLEANIAKAIVKQAEARLSSAKLAFARTRIKAPIDGTVGQLLVATGAYVEAEGGTVLLELVQLNPVLVSYSVPYKVRQEAMAAAGTTNVSELLKRLRLSLRLPDGQTYSIVGKALFESARIAPETKALKVWGEFPNPDRTLIPGLDVRVTSRLTKAAKSGSQ